MGRLVLAAALLALMLSACAPMAAAIRLPTSGACPWGKGRDVSGNCADTCALRNCGANSRCLKDEAGWANCVCLRGFQLLPNASCAHSCAILVCDVHATCVKEEDSLATCVCNWGYAMTPDNGCVDTCVLKSCVGNGTCQKDVNGTASCVCGWGSTLQLDKRTCADNCEIQSCGANGQCQKDAAGAASCVCDTGYTLQSDGRTCKDNCEIQSCGANGQCQKDAAGAASCVCDTGYTLQSDGRTCKDNCEIQSCGANGQCQKDAAGAASCACDTGYTLQSDGRTCKDNCEIQSCGANGQCYKNETTGEAFCVCDDYYVLQGDGRTCTDICIVKDCAVSLPNSHCVKANLTATCECNKKFALSEGTCHDTCELKACVNGTCSQDEETGEASCACYPDFELQSDNRTCIDICVLANCTANSYCVKEAGKPTCPCLKGFDKSGDLCVDTCELKGCVDGECFKYEETGAAYCVCNATAGLALLPDETTCQDACTTAACDDNDANRECIRNPENPADVRCECKTNYTMFEGKCTDVCVIKEPDCASADVNSTCYKRGGQGVCDCKEGYALSEDGKCTDTCDLKGCVGGTCNKYLDGMAYCSCDADAGFVLLADQLTCEHVCISKNCEANDPNSYCTWTRENGASCPCQLKFQESAGKCTDTCELQKCGEHSECQYHDDGSAYCVCDTGFTLQPDGVTCKDNCAILMESAPCTGVNEQCGTDPTTGVASCVCKPYYHRNAGTCVNKCFEPVLFHCKDDKKTGLPLAECVRRVDGNPFCMCEEKVDPKTGNCIVVIPGSPDQDYVNATWPAATWPAP
ncbi:hypothetical protein CLOM_g3794 [Closterium sp. NIES-68]|nr:hypothetical protein CLOM_g3794 [Closterium sp. NIES-68]GJP79815.1 hypothetical protein CLOP_g10025 [Closterium sp. NIES-67]